jgi:hypothetical protein
MTSKNELKLAVGLLVVCLCAGILGYAALPAKTAEVPLRRMFEASNGGVLFDHQTHSEAYGLYCEDCHHAFQEAGKESPGSCNECHTSESEHQPALGGKGMFNHDAHAQEYGLYCNDCHHNYQQGDPQEPQHCTVCHRRGEGDAMMPGRKDAFHMQCMGCHEDFGAGPLSTDCAGCHGMRDRTDAYHTQCMGCHEDFGAGPGNEDCSQCHAY